MRSTPILIAATLILGACGGGDGDGGDDEPAEDADPADLALAEESLLELSDFPTGWSEVPEEDVEPGAEEMQGEARECMGGDSDGFGGATASTGTFNGPSNEEIGQAINLFPTPADAEELMDGVAGSDVAACLADVYNEAMNDLLQDADDVEDDVSIGDVTVGELSVADAGDESVAYRVTVPVEVDGSVLGEIIVDLVVVRVGRAVSALDFTSEFSGTEPTTIDEYNSLAASKLPTE